MKDRDRLGDLTEIFEILVASYERRGGALPAERELYWRPATDAYETEDGFVVQMELSGMEPGQIEVVTDGKILLVRGFREDVSATGKKHFHNMEINVGPFERRLNLSVEVDPHSAVARYQNGFLYIRFRKGRSRREGRRRIDVDR